MSGRPLRYDDFSGGISRREGRVSRDRTRAWDVLNFQVTPGKKLKRRVPCTKLAGSLADANCFELNGKITAFMSRFDTRTHTVVGLDAPTQILYFDDPPLAASFAQGAYRYTVHDAVDLNGTVVALISHGDLYNSITRLHIHVFDQLRASAKTMPTYITDGGHPVFWTPRLPQHPYGTDDPGTGILPYSPRMAVDGGRVYVSLPNGDVAYCAVNRPRVWNTRTSAQILQDGRWWYFISDPGVNEVQIDAKFDDLWGTNGGVAGNPKRGGYAEVGLEMLNSDGTWSTLPYAGDDIASPTFGYYSTSHGNIAYPPNIVNVADTTILRFNVGGGKVLRFYVRAKPQAVILSGCAVLTDGSIQSGTISYQGVTLLVPEITRTPDADIDAGPTKRQSTYFGFRIGGTLAAPTFTWAWSYDQPKDGMVICAEAIVNPTIATPPVAHPGTVAFTGGSDAITGTGTNFPVTMIVGKPVMFTNGSTKYLRTVKAIGGATSMTVDRALPASGSGYFYAAVPWLEFEIHGRWDVAAGSSQIHIVLNNANFDIPSLAGLIGTTITLTGYATGGLTYTGKVINLTRSGASAEAVLSMDTAAASSDTGALAMAYIPLYNYDYELTAAGSNFYAEREAEAVLAAGFGDAGYIGSAQYADTGDVPVSMFSGQNRLFVQFANCLEMWAVDPQTFKLSYLAKQQIGAGKVAAPRPQMLDDGLLLPTEFGPRIFSPAGNSKDYITYAPIGDDLAGIALPKFQACAWWQGQNVAVMSSTDASDGVMWVFSYNRAKNVTGWGRWTIVGLTKIDKILTVSDTLLIFSAKSVYQFDPDATVFRDSTDGATAYLSRYQGLYTDGGLSGSQLRLTRMDVAQVGTANHSVLVSAAVPSDEGQADIVPAGYSDGLAKIPVLAIGPVIAPVVETTDEAGYELFSLSYDYIAMRR